MSECVLMLACKDRSRTPPRQASGRYHHPDSRDWDRMDRKERGAPWDYDNHLRGRSPRRYNQHEAYVDRDREGYRSSDYDSRSRSRSPRRRRSRSPYYGGPPSREVMMDGLPLDMFEEDVGHHPSYTLFTSPLQSPR